VGKTTSGPRLPPGRVSIAKKVEAGRHIIAYAPKMLQPSATESDRQCSRRFLPLFRATRTEHQRASGAGYRLLTRATSSVSEEFSELLEQIARRLSSARTLTLDRSCRIRVVYTTPIGAVRSSAKNGLLLRGLGLSCNFGPLAPTKRHAPTTREIRERTRRRHRSCLCRCHGSCIRCSSASIVIANPSSDCALQDA